MVVITVKGLSYEARLPSVEIAVAADREKLRQVPLNLLSNAVKFTQPGGRIVVEVAERADGTQPADLHARSEVGRGSTFTVELRRVAADLR
jgi:light-regulated signal transduction histidine kinase (bacteriophytochrome)